MIFLVLLAIASYLRMYVNNDFYWSIVAFLIDNVFLSLLIFVSTLIADIFWSFSFPFDVPAPILSGVSSIFIVSYLYRLWLFVESYIYTGIAVPIMTVYTAVFWLVMIIGYISVLARIGKGQEKEDAEEKSEKGKKSEKNEDREINWKDVGEQFKLAFYNLGVSLKNMFEPKNRK